MGACRPLRWFPVIATPGQQVGCNGDGLVGVDACGLGLAERERLVVALQLGEARVGGGHVGQQCRVTVGRAGEAVEAAQHVLQHVFLDLHAAGQVTHRVAETEHEVARDAANVGEAALCLVARNTRLVPLPGSHTQARGEREHGRGSA